VKLEVADVPGFEVHGLAIQGPQDRDTGVRTPFGLSARRNAGAFGRSSGALDDE
jgi:hypothetical protein